HKAFSMCLLHLAVVSLFVQLKSHSISSPLLNLLVSILYSVVPPALNPLIYSLRNKGIEDAVWRLMTECV
ncbi:OLF18 protein, partial [Centropus bengalensis]|nr:OLF18 protein [Centropus bengalensis]